MFANFWEMPVSEVTEEVIHAKCPSLGIAGWSDSGFVVVDYGVIELERRARDSIRVCWAFDPTEADDM